MSEVVEVGPAPGELDLEPVIYSRKLGDWIEVSSNLIRTGWATQRRRGFFGASNSLPI